MMTRNETRRESGYFSISEAVGFMRNRDSTNIYTHLDVAYINHI